MKLMKTLHMFGFIAALMGTTAASSFALPANEVETFYFSDANYEDEVGYTILACQGGVYREGQRTRYAVRSSTPCNGNGLSSEVHCRIYLNGSWYETTCPANICDSGLFDCQ